MAWGLHVGALKMRIARLGLGTSCGAGAWSGQSGASGGDRIDVACVSWGQAHLERLCLLGRQGGGSLCRDVRQMATRLRRLIVRVTAVRQLLRGSCGPPTGGQHNTAASVRLQLRWSPTLRAA